jgi:hypothetical protein
MADPQPFQFGSMVFPLPEQVSGASLLSVCDPALGKLIDFLAFEIDTKLAKVITGAMRPAMPVGKNIAKRLSVEPTDKHTKADSLAFPLFGIWRDESKHTNRTLNWRQDAHRLGWCYCLPPMTLEWADKFAHVLHAVVNIVNGALHQGYDPLFNNGERIVGDNEISSAKCTSAKYGPFQIGDQTDTIFYSVFGEIELIEQTEPNTTGLTPLQGLDLTVKQQALPDLTTRVTADASAAATSLQVASSEGFVEFDAVRIGEGTAREEVAIVSAVPDTTHLTLASGLSFAHTAAQADVVKRDPLLMLQAKSDVG